MAKVTRFLDIYCAHQFVVMVKSYWNLTLHISDNFIGNTYKIFHTKPFIQLQDTTQHAKGQIVQLNLVFLIFSYYGNTHSVVIWLNVWLGSADKAQLRLLTRLDVKYVTEMQRVRGLRRHVTWWLTSDGQTSVWHGVGICRLLVKTHCTTQYTQPYQ